MPDQQPASRHSQSGRGSYSALDVGRDSRTGPAGEMAAMATEPNAEPNANPSWQIKLFIAFAHTLALAVGVMDIFFALEGLGLYEYARWHGSNDGCTEEGCEDLLLVAPRPMMVILVTLSGLSTRNV